MKFLSFQAGGTARYGVVNGNDVIDLTPRLKYPDLKALLAADAIAEASRAAKGGTADFTLDQIVFAPLITDPGKIICVGLNYEDHRVETGMPKHSHPAVFTRWADSQIGHLAPMVKPPGSEQLDYEAELAVVIGKGGRYIKESDAASHIAGYSCYNDGSIRDYQRHASQFTPGKNFPGTGAFGPWLVTRDEIADTNQLILTTRLNGEVMQQASVANLIFTIPVIIEYLSAFSPLLPGDVIATGTPGGVGDRREPPLYMKDGDVVEVEIDRVGILRNTVQVAA
jgi:2-keto-4-pentenoate hydratase/2-oxohepta-3-ene-1,7-dioic acid hydratase in catechol pathway